MKKLLSLLLTLTMLLSLTACGGGAEPVATEVTVPTETVPTEPESPFASMTDRERAEAEAEIRYAFSLLLDRNYIIEEITQAEQIPASSFVPAGLMETKNVEFYQNAGSDETYDGYFSVAPEAYEDNYVEAYKILSKYYEVEENGAFANFPDLTYLYNIEDGQDILGEYLQSLLTAIGISVHPEKQELEEFLESKESGAFSLTRNTRMADYNDPVCFLEMWISTSGRNEAQLGMGAHADLAVYDLDLTELGYDIKVKDGTWAETYDLLIDTIKACTDETVRFSLMHKAEDLLMSTGAVIPLFYCKDLALVDMTVTGVAITPFGEKYFHKSAVNRKGEEISVGLSANGFSIDPAKSVATGNASLVSHLFAGLMKWNPDRNGNVTLAADCAERLGKAVSNEDGTVTYTYTLRRNIKWSDGEPLTAEDFVFAWNRAAAMEIESGDSCYFDVIQGYDAMKEGKPGAALAVTATNERTLQVTLNHPVSYWEELLTLPSFCPVREDVVANENWDTDPAACITNGGYIITDWSNESVLVLEKNMNYWDARNVTMKKVKFFLSDDFTGMLTNFRNDIWQVIDECPVNRVATVKEKYEDEFVVTDQIGTYYMCWNINEPLLP